MVKQKVTKAEMSSLPYIIAVDFDGTLVEDRFPEIGEPITRVWNHLKKARDNGAKIILWTCRNGDKLKEAVEFCAASGIHFDAINENLDECKVLFDNDTRKVYADEYWDDKSIATYCYYDFSKRVEY